MSFVHLHVHSEYSLLDGFSNIKKLVKRAQGMGMPALALTDHGTMFGVIDFYRAASEAGIKPIIGLEAYLAARTMKTRDPQLDKKSAHLLLLAENQTGYQNLLRLASAAQLEGFYYYPRIDHEILAKYNEGLICTSGCMSAEVPRLLQDGKLEGARKQLDWYFEVFGKDRYFLELQSHNIPELGEINKNLVALGKRYHASFVATNDVHYIDPQDARLQDIMLAIQTSSLLSDPNRMRMTDPTYYLRSPQEMAELFAEMPEALSNTLMIAERCMVDLEFKGYHLPQFEVPEGYTAETYLRELCEAGLHRRYGANTDDPAVRSRLDYELNVIHSMGFDTYFLIVWDLCRHAREESIWYNARGSAAGSIVAYCLDITLVDPIQHGLIFERFLNPGRISMPDIDLDFRDDCRAEMMEYTANKYGDDKVAQIITFGTLGARAAIRDVGRVMDIPLSEVDRVAKMVPNIPGKPVTIAQALEEVSEFKQLYKDTPYLHELIDTATQMEGVVRNAGTHAAGVIITDKPIIEYIPLHRPTGASAEDSPVKIVTQFEMSVLESLGLLKVDFLGLATLTIMARACELITQRHGVNLHLGNTPIDDPATYELLGRGETAGVFQVEGSGMRRWLIEMKPKELANVIAMVALFRPGPMDFIPGYIRRMHGEEAVTYKHPTLEPIFKETYGYPVYQEQLMFAVMQLAGYTAPEADDLRKAISKKIKEKLHKHREKFIAGAVKNGISKETAEAIFDDWEEFARYGFNKAHAADYGVIAVQTAYLKAHYPVEYMTALLSVTQSDTDKVALYVADCRRMGVRVEPPDINASGWDFTIEDKEGGSTIRFGLGAVKNVGHGPVKIILEGRGEQPFRDLDDFAHRVDLRQVGKRALESLVRVGALDCFGNRLALLDGLDRIISVSTAHFRAREAGQMSLFGAHTGVVESISLPPAAVEIARREILNWERELIGLYVSDHPLSPVIEELNRAVSHFSGQLQEASHNERVRVAGMITRVRPHQTKTGKSMAFVAIEDLQGVIELVIFPKTWERLAEMIAFDKIILVDGRLDLQGAEPKVLVDNITSDFTLVSSADDARAVAPLPRSSNSHLEEDAASDEDSNGVDSLGTFSTPQSAVDTSTPAKDEPPPPDTFPDDWSSPDTGPVNLGVLAAMVFAQGGVPAQTSPAGQVSVSENEIILAGAAEPQVTKLPTAGPLASEPQATSSLAELDERIEEPATDPAPEGPAMRHSTASLPTPQSTAESDAEKPDLPTETVTPTPYFIPEEAASTDKVPSAQYLVSPIQAETSEQVRMVTVVLRSSGDKTRDVLRLRRLHGTIMSYPGNDRFAFHVFERNRGYLVEFPNFTTGVCPDLLSRLRLLVGADNVRVEAITFQ